MPRDPGHFAIDKRLTGYVSPLEEFLFAPKPHGMGAEDFTQLVERLALHGGTDTRTRTSLRTSLSKYFLFAAPLPPDFTHQLSVIAATEDVLPALRRAVEQHQEMYFRRTNPIGLMSQHYTHAAELVFLCLEPMTSNLEKVPAALSELLKLSFGEAVAGTLKKSTMCIPDKSFATIAWRHMEAQAREWASEGRIKAEEVLTKLDDCVTILLLPPRLCIHPTFVFDPRTESACGYVWHMPWDWRTLALMPASVLKAWKREILTPIDQRKLDGEDIPIIRRRDVSTAVR